MLQLKKFSDIPAPLESIKIFPPTFRGAPFPPHSSRGGILSLRGLESIPGVPVASQEEALSTGKASGTPGCATNLIVPQRSQSIPGKPVFPALPRVSSRGSTHTTLARGTALWESLVGKPCGKDSRKSHSPCEFLGGLSGFLSRRFRGLRPCVESVPEPEDSSPVLTWILGYFWSLPRGVSPRLQWGHARALSSRGVAAVSRFYRRGSRDL